MCVVNPVTEIAKIAVDTVRLIQTVQVTAAENKVANYNAQQSINQAKIAEKNAVYERQEGIEDAREKRLQAIKNMGSTKTTLASGNISMSSLSALDLIEDEKISGEIDALKIIDSSERRAQSYLDTSQRYYSNAALQSYKAKQNSIIKSFGILGMTGNSVFEYYNNKRG